MGSWFDEEGSLKESNEFSGVHRCMIKEAEHKQTDTSEGIILRVAMLDRLDSEGKPKEITLETIWLTNKSGRNVPTANYVGAMFQLLGANGASPKFKNYNVQRYNFETKETEPTEVKMFSELMLKKVSLYIQKIEDYPRKKVDYNTQEVVGTDEKGAWVPDYSKEPKLIFRFHRAFDIATNQTYSEKKDGKTAQVFKDLMKKYSDRDAPLKMSDNELLDSIQKQAVANGDKELLDTDIFNEERGGAPF